MSEKERVLKKISLKEKIIQNTLLKKGTKKKVDEKSEN